MLRITTNDIYNPVFEVPCTLELRAPEDDDEITDILLNNDTPKEFNLAQNYPNPFNPDTKIKFFLPTSENVKIEIYNAIGQKIETLIDKRMNAGHHEVEFHAQNLSSGLYLYKIEAGKFYDVKRMVLLK
jgi:hypothetical protein